MPAPTPSALPRLVELPGGRAVWRVLDWDSEQFGFPSARVERLEASGAYAEARETKSKLLKAVLGECRGEGIRHLTARVDAADLTATHALEEAGFELIDAIQTFSIELNGRLQQIPGGTRLLTPDDVAAVLEIGRTAFVHDRFHADPSLGPGVADRVNEVWTRNCCLGTAADGVVVAEDGGRVASFVTCRLDVESRRGTIILVATAEWARGRGAARRATVGSLQVVRDTRHGDRRGRHPVEEHPSGPAVREPRFSPGGSEPDAPQASVGLPSAARAQAVQGWGPSKALAAIREASLLSGDSSSSRVRGRAFMCWNESDR